MTSLGLSLIETLPLGEMTISLAMTAVAAQAPNPTSATRVVRPVGIQSALKEH
jgi:hypothetical protein